MGADDSIIFNPDQRTEVTLRLLCNISVKQSWIINLSPKIIYDCSGKEVSFTVRPTGCSFFRAEIKDPNNNITYRFKICVINLHPRFLESVQTCYLLEVPKNTDRAVISAIGFNDVLVINPMCDETLSEIATQGRVYSCNYNQTLVLSINEEALNMDTGSISFFIKCGAVTVPIQIKDDPVKPVELTGIGAMKKKLSDQRSMEYRNGKIIDGTSEYFSKSPFRESLELEWEIVQNNWLAVNSTVNGTEECVLTVPESVRQNYVNLVQAMKRRRTVPSLAYYSDDLLEYAEKYISSVEEALASIPAGQTLNHEQNDLLLIGCVVQDHDEHTISLTPLHPINVLYQLVLRQEQTVGEVRENLMEKLNSLYLLPYIKDSDKALYHAIEQRHSPEWRVYAKVSNKRFQGARNFVQKLVGEKIEQYIGHFRFLFDDIGNDQMYINLVSMGDCREVIQGLIRYYAKKLKEESLPERLLHFVINIYSEPGVYNEFSVLSDHRRLREYISTYGKDADNVEEMALLLSSNIRCYYRNIEEEQYHYAHLTFYEMETSADDGDSRMDSITTGISLGGLTSGTPSVLNSNWYKTGFGTKYAQGNRLLQIAKLYNALFRVAFSGSSYEPESAIFTSIASNGKGQLGKIYDSSNWVVFVNPKVDLSFFKHEKDDEQDVMIIHYSDQYTSASGYDDITVTQKSEQYEEIIQEQLQSKGVIASKENVHDIISLFNAINGGWMLRLMSAKKSIGATDSNFSREKISILSAVKVCMAYYSHPNVVWVPISLEEMLRVSGGAGYSQKDGLLSAKNLGFEKGATSDDILLVGIEGPKDDIKVYLHPVEVKIGQNPTTVITKANEQVLRTYNGLWNALWPEAGYDALECKLSRNFLMQLVIAGCEKMQLYGVYPNDDWETVTDKYRQALLNEHYRFSRELDNLIGKGTVISFRTGALNKSGTIINDVCLLEFPEIMGSEYMVKSAREIESDLDSSQRELPDRLKYQYAPLTVTTSVEQPTTTDQSVHLPFTATSNDLPNNNSNEEGQTYQPQIDIETRPESESEFTKSDPAPTIVAELPRKTMEILFGTDESSGRSLIWYPNDTNQVFHTNMGIIGTMGTGKTQFTKSVITQLYHDQTHNFDGSPLGMLIFDYKGDYNESKEDFVKATDARILKPYHLPFNPLALTKSRVFKPLLPIHTANAFKDTLSKVYGLGAKQQNTLFQCITQAYTIRGIDRLNPDTWDNVPPTFDMVYNLYTNDDTIKKGDSLAAAMEKLYQFQVFEGDPSKTISLFKLLDGVIVIDLSGYDPDIQSLIVAITLDLFYSQMQAAGSSKMDHQYRQLTKIILVDEADNFMSEGFPSLKKILKEGREFGVGTILSTQFLKHFGSTDDDYAKYILTWVVHNVSDLKQSDVDFVFKVEAKSAESLNLYNDIKSLQKHHSIVKIGTARPSYIRDRAFWELYHDMETEVKP